MPRQKNDGRGRVGGRAKGTPNKDTADLREWVRNLVDDNRDQIVADLAELEPRERIAFLEKMMRYVIPQQSQITQEATDGGTEKLLAKIAAEEPILCEWIQGRYSDEPRKLIIGFDGYEEYKAAIDNDAPMIRL